MWIRRMRRRLLQNEELDKPTSLLVKNEPTGIDKLFDDTEQVHKKTSEKVTKPTSEQNIQTNFPISFRRGRHIKVPSHLLDYQI